MLQPNMLYLNDEEGEKVSSDFPPIIDSHVHLFPQAIFSSVWKWFDTHAWHVRYPIPSTQIVEFLLSHGVKHIVALQYAHKSGIARQLNEYMLEKVKQFGGHLTGLATVYPGEENAELILQDAFDAGLKGVKLHMHVQCFDMNHNYMNPLYDCCQKNNKPLVIHAGREPKSTAYACDPHQLCNINNVVRILKDFPRLKICVPHLGFDELDAYKELIESHDNLWLDTAMILTNYFPESNNVDLNTYRAERVMYGSDFPNIPYAWDRELKALEKAAIGPVTLEKILYKNTVEFFNIELVT